MLIKEIYQNEKPVISFEVFPPKKDYPIETVYKTIDELKDLKPDYISVTYGAGGSSRDRTFEITSKVKREYNIECMAHLTCITSEMHETNEILNHLEEVGVKNLSVSWK